MLWDPNKPSQPGWRSPSNVPTLSLRNPQGIRKGHHQPQNLVQKGGSESRGQLEEDDDLTQKAYQEKVPSGVQMAHRSEVSNEPGRDPEVPVPRRPARRVALSVFCW